MKIMFLAFAVFIIPAAILVAGPHPVNEPTFKAGPFVANYFEEQDDQNAGYGNDGQNNNVETRQVYSETVLYPSMNGYEHILHINPYNIMVTWEGPINVFTELETINANFFHSWSHVAVFVDNNLVSRWKNESSPSRTIPLELTQGEHHVKIEFHNHWHSSNFTASFTKYPAIDDHREISSVLGINDWDDVLTINWSTRNAVRERFNERLISLPEIKDPVVLFLTSREPVNWVVSNPFNDELLGIILVLTPKTSASTVLCAKRCNVYAFTKRLPEPQKLTGRQFNYSFKD